MRSQWNNPWAYVWFVVCTSFVGVVPVQMHRADSAQDRVLWFLGGLAVLVGASVMKWRWRPDGHAANANR